MRKSLILVTAAFVLLISACKKSRIKKQIEGTWQITAMYTDERDFLLQKRKGSILQIGCDTLDFERTEILNSVVIFDANGSYTRTENIIIKYLDTAKTRIHCQVVYGDSALNKTEIGSWRFEGSETLEMIAQNNNYEGNKLKAISNSEMEWQTDIVVNQGKVIFNGIKTTKLIKR